MSNAFASQVAELERALALVESSLEGAPLERTRALVAAVLEVHRSALLDLQRALGDAELGRAAAAEPSVAWLLACHELETETLGRAVAAAEAKAARLLEKKARAEPAFVPISRLVRRVGEPAP
jgi:hypothetical protein